MQKQQQQKGTEADQLTQTGLRDIPCHTTSRSAIKLWQKVKRVGGSDLQGGCCLETGWALVCLGEGVSDSLCITCFFSFLDLLNCLYPDPQVLSLFLFLFSPLSTRSRGERLSGCVGVWLGPTHDRVKGVTPPSTHGTDLFIHRACA